MNPTLLLGGVSLAALYGAYRLVTPIVLKPFALQDRFWTLMPSSGVGKVAIRGGDFDHAILSFEGWHLNDPRKRWYDRRFPKWEVLPNAKPAKFYDDRWSVIEAFGGYWVGLPWNVGVYGYETSWNEPILDDKGKPSYRARPDEKTKVWYAKAFEYVFMFDALTKDNLRVEIQYGLTVRITNPEKALFKIDDWLQRVEVAAGRVAKNFIGTHDYAFLRGAGDNDINPAAKENFSEPIRKLTYQLLDEDPPAVPYDYKTGTSGNYGITIDAADFRRLELAGPFAEENEKNSVRVFGATEVAKAEVIESEAKATVLTNVGTAEANVIKLKGEATAAAAKARIESYATNPAVAHDMQQNDALSTGRAFFVTGPVAKALEKVGDVADRFTPTDTANTGGQNTNGNP